MSTLNDKDRENLTAYLDGELDDDAARRLEAKINLDPDARKEVDALKQAWSMLDYLPKPTPSAGFTHRTLDRLSVAKMVTQIGGQARQRAYFWARTIAWVVAILGSAGVGLGAGRLFFRSNPEPVVVDTAVPVAVPVATPVARPVSDEEWISSQSKAQRDQYGLLNEDAKTEFIGKLRLEDRKRRHEWLIAGRFWRELEKGLPLPARMADFPADVNSYFADYLRHLLSKEEIDQLEKTQGQWPLYPMTLVELADKHPPALPGVKGPKSFAELPAEVRNKFKLKAGGYPPKLAKAEGQWPRFALAVTSFASGKKNYVLPHEMWAWGHSCLTPRMQDFVDNKLAKVLDSEEKPRLMRTDGKWPEYPIAIQELAKKYNLPVPWHTLPGSRERWDNYRTPTLD